MGFTDRGVRLAVVLGLTAVLAGLWLQGSQPGPDRGARTGLAALGRPEWPWRPRRQQPPGFENAGKAGYYTVKPGDTMTRIGLETGQSWRDIARWNGLVNPNLIEVGQVLRVVPPCPSWRQPRCQSPVPAAP